MRLTEQQLYNMICESINDVLKEANGGQQSKYPMVNGNFDENGDTNGVRRTWHNIRKTLHNPSTARTVASGIAQAGSAIGGAFSLGKGAEKAQEFSHNEVIDAANGGELSPKAVEFVKNNRSILDNPDGTNFDISAVDVIKWGIGIMLGAMVIRNIANLWNAVKSLDTKTVPSNYGSAIKSLRFAGIERIESQKLCLQTQTSIKNAINAYYLVYKDSQLDIDTMMSNAGKMVGVSCSAQDLDINFTDRLAMPPTKLQESTNNGQTVQKYVQMFQQINNAENSKEVLITSMSEFAKALGVWKSMTIYIQKIVKEYGALHGITMETALMGGKQSIPFVGASISAARNAAQKTGKGGVQLLQKLTQDKQGPQDDIADNTIKNLNTRVVNPGVNLVLQTNAHGQPTKTMNCVILQQEKTNHYFAIPTNNIPQVSRGQGYIMPYAEEMITKIIRGNNGAPIYIMGQYNQDLSPINDGIQ